MRLWPLFIFWCLWYLNYSTRAVLAPLLPVIEDSLSLSHGQSGGLFTSLSIGYGICLFLAGRFGSAWGHKRMVVFGFTGGGIVLIILQWTNTYLALHAIFLLMGLTLGTYIPAILPIITETYEQRHWGKAIALHDSAASFAMFSAPILVAFSLHFVPWRRVLLILGIACLLLPIYFWKVATEPRRQVTQRGGRYLDLFRRRTVWIMAILWIVANMFCNAIYAVLPLYLVKERGIGFDHANTLIGISRIGAIFVTIVSGFLADRYGYQKILMMIIFATGISTIGLALVHPIPLLIFILIFQAVVSLAFFPLALSAISKLTSLEERSMVTGVILSIGVVYGAGVAPFLLGSIADRFNFQLGILGVGILTTLSCLLVGSLRETQETKG